MPLIIEHRRPVFVPYRGGGGKVVFSHKELEEIKDNDFMPVTEKPVPPSTPFTASATLAPIIANKDNKTKRR